MVPEEYLHVFAEKIEGIYGYGPQPMYCSCLQDMKDRDEATILSSTIFCK